MLFKILTGKPTGKRPLGRPRRRWEENIRMDLEEIGSMRGIGLIQLRIGIIWRALVNAVLNLRVPLAMELVIQLVMVRPFPEDIQNLQDSFEENF